MLALAHGHAADLWLAMLSNFFTTVMRVIANDDAMEEREIVTYVRAGNK